MKNSRRFLLSTILFVPALFQLFPLVYLICLSFKMGVEVFDYPPRFFPNALNFDNYKTALVQAPLFRFLLNSAIVSLSQTGLQLFTSIFAAYAFSTFQFRGKKILFVLCLAALMVPHEVTIIPNYFTCARLRWLDSYWSLILPFSASPLGIVLLYQFFSSVPKELREVAQLEGCSHLRFLFQILIPVSRPALYSFGIYAFIQSWNLYLWPLVVTQSTELQTAQIGLGMFRSQNESLSWGVLMAATTILVMPTLLVFLLTQKQFLKGLAWSGLKG